MFVIAGPPSRFLLPFLPPGSFLVLPEDVLIADGAAGLFS